MKLSSVLSILPALIGLGSSQFTDMGPQILYLGALKFAPALPGSNRNITRSSSGSGQIVIGNAPDPSFPISYETFPTGHVTSTEVPGALALVDAGRAADGYYNLVWVEDSTLGTDFTATSCECGGNCGGYCLRPGGAGLPGSFIVQVSGGSVDGEFNVGWSNSTDVLDSTYRAVFMWRRPWGEFIP